MCTVSMVGDHYRDIWKDKPFWPQPPYSPYIPLPNQTTPFNGVSREEFNELKRQVEEMKLLLARAKEYDERNNEPECEVAEKMELLRKIAALVGVNLDDVLGSKSPE